MGINGVFAFCILHGNIHDSRNQRAYQTPRRIGSVNCFGGSYKAGPAIWTGGKWYEESASCWICEINSKCSQHGMFCLR